MNENIFTHDHFNTWQTCPKRYYFKYVKKLNWPDFNRDYELGKKVHALIDYYLRGLKINHLLKDAPDDVLECWNLIKNHSVLNKNLIKTEWSFNSRIKNNEKTENWLKGRIDAVFYDTEQKKYIIVDWKTGKYIPKNIETNFQHKIYLYAFYNSRNDLKLDFKQEDLEFLYVKIKDKVSLNSINFSKEKEIEYKGEFLDIIKQINNTQNFINPDICPLKQCNYKNLCFKNV